MTVDAVDFQAKALDFEVTQFKDKPKSLALLYAIMDQLQEADATAIQIAEALDVQTAVGLQLDKLGRIVQLAREGREDDEYRAAIIAKIVINMGSGTVEDIIFAVRTVCGTPKVSVYELPNTAIYVAVQVPYTNEERIEPMISLVKAAGVALDYVVAVGPSVGSEDYTVADIAEMLTLTELVVGDLILVLDSTSIYEYLGGDMTLIASYELVGPPLVFLGDSDGEGLASLSDVTGSGELIGGGVLAQLIV